jgi:cytochrome c peroxidase
LAVAIVMLVGTATLVSWSEEKPNEPTLGPLPRTAPAPEDNPTTPGKVSLGKQLFFDVRLSGDNTTSCATCHLPEKAFADGQAGAKGAGGKTLARNTPSVLNAGFFPRLTWDGRAKSLEEQALGPITSPDEMDQDLGELERELAAVPGYARRFRQVFGKEVDRDGIGKALAAFQRTLVSGPSPFDRHLAGDEAALSEEAKRGLELFVGPAGCVRCHKGPLLSDGEFYRLGVSIQDEGRAAVTGRKEDQGKFRTPSLRDIARTGPYMHDGSLATLEDVATFYYRGVPSKSADGLPLDVEPLLGQSFSEIADLVAFLQSLSGEVPQVEPPELP